jgi:hypothetical protein
MFERMSFHFSRPGVVPPKAEQVIADAKVLAKHNAESLSERLMNTLRELQSA